MTAELEDTYTDGTEHTISYSEASEPSPSFNVAQKQECVKGTKMTPKGLMKTKEKTSIL